MLTNIVIYLESKFNLLWGLSLNDFSKLLLKVGYLLYFYRYGISGFPAFKFFPKDNKDGEDYDGGRDVDDFVNFINLKSGTNRDSKGQLTVNVSKQPNPSMFKFYFLLLC